MDPTTTWTTFGGDSHHNQWLFFVWWRQRKPGCIALYLPFFPQWHNEMVRHSQWLGNPYKLDIHWYKLVQWLRIHPGTPQCYPWHCRWRHCRVVTPTAPPGGRIWYYTTPGVIPASLVKIGLRTEKLWPVELLLNRPTSRALSACWIVTQQCNHQHLSYPTLICRCVRSEISLPWHPRKEQKRIQQPLSLQNYWKLWRNSRAHPWTFFVHPPSTGTQLTHMKIFDSSSKGWIVGSPSTLFPTKMVKAPFVWNTCSTS